MSNFKKKNYVKQLAETLMTILTTFMPLWTNWWL